VQLDRDDRVEAFLAYPRPPGFHARNLVNAALYWVRKDKLALWCSSRIPLDFGRDVFPQILEDKGQLYGYRSSEYIKDAGTPARLDRVAADIESGRVAAANLRKRRPAIFLDRDGTLNVDHGFIKRPGDIQLFPGAAEAVRRINDSGYLAVIVTNQPVIARGDCTETQLEQVHARLEELLGEGGAYVDRIYYCPHHPDAGFPNERPELKFKCDCRKPQPRMIRQAVDDNSIELAKSFIIGDSTADFLMANQLGLHSIGVATGSAGLDEKYPVEPDYSATDIASAVSFILDVHPSLLEAVRPLVHSIQREGLVFIGGVARSGKSTLAHALAECLSADNRGVRILALDRWIRSLTDRGSSMFERYDVAEIKRALTKLAPPRSRDVTLDLPFYFRRSRSSRTHAETMSVKPDDMVMVEGTIALLLSSDIPGRRVYVQSPLDDRRDRFIRLQQLRGSAPKEADDLFIERENEETSIVADSGKSADIVVTFTSPFQISITDQ
jgi:D,D-heptose 1,7-bisphosphate phosphatase